MARGMVVKKKIVRFIAHLFAKFILPELKEQILLIIEADELVAKLMNIEQAIKDIMSVLESMVYDTSDIDWREVE